MLVCRMFLLLATFAAALEAVPAGAREAVLPQPQALPLMGHKGAVPLVAIPRRGNAVATAGTDGTIRIWDATTGDQLHKLQIARKAAGMAFAPDGKTLVSLSSGKKTVLVLWDAVAGKPVQRLSLGSRKIGGPGPILDFSPGGKAIAAGLGDVTSTISTVSLRTSFIRFRSVHGGVSAVSFAPAGQHLAVGDESGTVYMLDGGTGRVQYQIRCSGKVTMLAFHRDGTKLMVADGSRSLRILEIGTRKEQAAFASKDAITALALSPDGKQLATAGDAGTVLLWDISGKKQRQFRAGGAVTALAYSPDGKRLATVGPEGAVLWNLTRDEKPLPRDFKLSPKELERHWDELAAGQGDRVYTAARLLRADPARSVPFIQKHLAPKDAGPDPKKIKQLIADLDSDEFMKREAATKELGNLGMAIESDLRDALSSPSSLEAASRLKHLLKRLEEHAQTRTALQQRDVRAVHVLEQVGTPEAKKVLETLSTKASGWWVQREARDALERLGWGGLKR